MKGWKILGAFVLFVVVTLILVSAGESKQQPPATPPAAAPVPIVVDEQFAHDYEQFQALAREVSEMQAEMSAIQGRSQVRLEKLKSWMGDHHVPPTWTYEPLARRFVAPVQPAPPPKQSGEK